MSKSFSYVTKVLIDHHEGIKTPVFDPPEPDTLRVWLSSLKPETRIEVSYKVIREVRSLAQNRRYWSQIVPMVAEVLSQELPRSEMPVSKDEAHEKLKEHFIGFRVTSLGKIPKHSKELDVPQFKDYCDRIEEWLVVKYGVVIPARGEEID